MKFKACAIAWMLAAKMAALSGCASAPAAPPHAPVPWLDDAFHWQAGRVEVTQDELFRVPDDLRAKLDAQVRDASPNFRLNRLITLIFGADRRGFTYAAGHSTTAAQTWNLKRGDCLSLTILTYASARAAGLTVAMQEVRTAGIFDRRGQFDTVNQHVNAVFPRAFRDLSEDKEPRDVVVDFDPEMATSGRGTMLTQEGILARFYNNVAVEQLAAGEHQKAYAHFKAAIQSDPRYAASYANLAVLYQTVHRDGEAERLLRTALGLSDQNDVALQGLHQLLLRQGRSAEARQYALQIDARRESDPYHWIGVGVKHLQSGEPRRAIRALERAKELAVGFPEVHRYLAVAYAQAGDRRRADQELTVLASSGFDQGKLSVLRKKVHSLQ
jgi:Tfp pilus assembly protein PilF